ncbi:replication/maintenance protein RepL [Streptomyces sp. NPDC001436]
MSVQALEDTPRPLLWGNYNIFAYMPDLPGFSLKVLLYCLGHQEAGGRIVQNQKEIAEWLDVSRSLVQKSMKHLQLARILLKEGNGIYRLNPMVAAYPTPAESQQAIKGMDRSFRLDTDDFAERYERAVEEYEASLKVKAAARSAAVHELTDLAAHRRRKASQG